MKFGERLRQPPFIQSCSESILPRSNRRDSMSHLAMVVIKFRSNVLLTFLPTNTVLPTDASRLHRFGAIALLVSLTMAPVACAQMSAHATRTFDGVGLRPKLGAIVPLEAMFANSHGQPVTLGDLLDSDKPAILTFVYHTCPMLCSALLDGVTRTVKEIPWTPGEEYDMITISINPDDAPDIAQRQRDLYVDRLRVRGATWHFLTGREESIREVTRAVGFGYRWDEDIQEYAHPAAIIILTGSGTVSRYFPEINPRPRDLRASLVEAASGTLGSLSDRVFLYCFQYDPARNSYVMTARSAMRVGGILTALVLALSLILLWIREARTNAITA